MMRRKKRKFEGKNEEKNTSTVHRKPTPIVLSYTPQRTQKNHPSLMCRHRVDLEGGGGINVLGKGHRP